MGSKAGKYLGDAIRDSMDPGYYYNNSAQTYKFLNGNTWQWIYGGNSIENETTGEWWFYNSPAPPNIYANGL